MLLKGDESENYVRPPHGVAVGQIMVGVQIEFVGQGPSLPTVQGIAGGRGVGVKQSPLYVRDESVLDCWSVGK